MSTGRRYEKNRGRKLNIKKVIGVAVAIAVVIMSGISLSSLLNEGNNKDNKQGQNYYFSAYKNDRWGVINKNGEEVIPVIQNEMIIVPDNTQDIFITMTDVNYETGDYKTEARNSKGDKLFEEYETIEAIDNFENGDLWYEKGVLRVKKDGKYGLINFKGEELLKCEYSKIESLKGITNSLIIEKDGKLGLASNVGDIVIETKYNEISAFGKKYTDGYIVKDDSGNCGIIGSNKKVILAPIYEEIKNVPSNNGYVVKQDGKLKVVDSDGNEILSGYDDYAQVEKDIIIAKKGENYGAVSSKGEEKIPFEYQELTYVLNKYIAKKSDKYGVLDESGSEKLPFEYEYIYNRKDTDFIEADKNAQTEVYNKDMELKLTGILSEVNTEEGYIILRKDGEWKFYNFKFEEKQEKDIFPNHTLFLSKKDGKYGYTNSSGEIVVDYIYDDAKLQNKYGYACVNKGGKWGSLNKDGNISEEPSQDMKDYLVIDFIGKWHLGKELEMNYYTD